MSEPYAVLQEQLDDAHAEIEDLKIQLDDTKDDLHYAEAEIHTLEGRLDDADDEHEAVLDTAKRYIATLEEELYERYVEEPDGSFWVLLRTLRDSVDYDDDRVFHNQEVLTA